MPNPSSFYQSCIAELGGIPRLGLIYLGLLGVASAGSELFLWSHRPALLPLDIAILAVVVAASVVAIYAVSMMMIAARCSVQGLIKFVATWIAMALPVLLSLGLLIVASRASYGAGVAASVVLLLASIVILALMPGWPLRQAVSTTFVGPREAFRSTYGFRWQLIAGALIAGNINRVVPSVADSHDLWTACFIAAVGGIAAVGSAMVGLAISVSAWRRMQQTIESIAP